MKKTLILLLILAMVLPMCLVANAAVKPGSKLPTPYTLKIGGTSYKLVNYDTPIYTVNTPLETQDVEGNKFTKVGQNMMGANEDNYNAKLIWNSTDDRPTLILRGFIFDEWNNETGLMEGKWDAANEKYKQLQTYSIVTDKNIPLDIVLTGEDSLIEAMFGITFYHDTTITSDGATKLTMNNEASCIAPNQSTGSLTINANLDLTLGRFYNTQYASAVIHTYGGDLTINGGHLDLKCNTKETKVLTALHARNGANLTINGGVINAMSIIGTARNNGCIRAEGKLTINGGYVTALPKDALGLHGRAGIEMNGGIVNTTAKLWAISFGVNADDPKEFVFNGGTLTATSKRVFHDECRNIKLGAGVTVYAGTDEANAKVYDGTETKYANQSWVRFTGNSKHAPGWDGKDDAAPTLPATKPTTAAPTTKPTQVPTTAPTQAPTVAPTAAPTKAPTAAPTSAPTKAPIAETSRVTRPHLTVPTKAPTSATKPAVTTAPAATTAPTSATKPVATKSPTVATTAPEVTLAPTQVTEVTEVTNTTAATEATQAPVTEATKAPATQVTQTPTEAAKETEETKQKTDKDDNKAENGKDKDSNVVLIVAIAAIIVLAGAGAGTAVYFLVIKKKQP